MSLAQSLQLLGRCLGLIIIIIIISTERNRSGSDSGSGGNGRRGENPGLDGRRNGLLPGVLTGFEEVRK